MLGSIEGGFVSSPNAFQQTLGLFCCNYSFVNPSWVNPSMSLKKFVPTLKNNTAAIADCSKIIDMF